MTRTTKKALISAERLREVLRYDPETGVFTWRISTSATGRAGNRAGTTNTIGYRQIKIDRRVYLEHRLAWLYVHGAWPDECIDHINRIRDDNRISNLRQATRAQNIVNVAWSDTNACGFRGTTFLEQSGKYVARLGRDLKSRHLGVFETAEEAHAAYKRELVARYGEFAPEEARRD